MRTNARKTRIGPVTPLLLLFVRTADDLVHSCRQVEEFLAYCRSRQGGAFAGGQLLGVWIDENAVTDLPQGLTLRLPTNRVITLAVRETFSLVGVWSVASFELQCPQIKAGITLSHDLVLDALLALARGDTGRVGCYSPAFAHDRPKTQVRTEIKRLNTRYPLRIERPVYYDPVTGGLSLDEEQSRMVRMEKP